MDKQYKIVIAKIGEGVARLRAAKVLRTLKSISLSEALDLIDSAPCTVYEGPKAEADRVAKELSQAGANINIDEIVAEPEPKSETKCKIHNKEAVDTCMNCGQPVCDKCLAEEGNYFYCSKCFSQRRQSQRKEELPKCPSCGSQVEPNAVFCINCGLNLKTGEKIKTHEGYATEITAGRRPSKPSQQTGRTHEEIQKETRSAWIGIGCAPLMILMGLMLLSMGGSYGWLIILMAICMAIKGIVSLFKD